MISVWTILIYLAVAFSVLASGLLNLAAMSQWRGRWRRVSAAPLAALALAMAGLVLATASDTSQAGILWPLALFCWSVANLTYMVILLTLKAKLQKMQREPDGDGAG